MSKFHRSGLNDFIVIQKIVMMQCYGDLLDYFFSYEFYTLSLLAMTLNIKPFL